MHVATDGAHLPLEELIRRIAVETRAELLLTIGTAGGARLDQCIGTVVVSNAFKLDLEGDLAGRPFSGDFFGSDYRPDRTLLERVRARLFRNIPVRRSDLRQMASSVGCSLDQVMNPAIEPGRLDRRIHHLIEREQPTLLSHTAQIRSAARGCCRRDGRTRTRSSSVESGR